MSDTQASCTKCGTTISAGKRFKDSKGRPFCEPCAAALRAKAAAKLGTTPGSAAPTQHHEPEDGTIALADEPASAPARAVQGPRVGGILVCPDCGHPITGASDICKGCGYNRKTGRHMGAGSEIADEEGTVRRPPVKPCKKCGYDMTGSKTGQCPECGTINIRMSRARETEQQTLLKMYTQPLIMIAIGVGIAVIVHFLKGLGASSAASGMGSAIAYLAIYFVSVPIGFAAYVGCSIAFVGFDEPLGVTFVRLAGVYAVLDAVGAVLGTIPMLGWWVAWPIQAFIYIGMLMQIMELDLEDAWVVAGVTYIVHMGVGITLIWVWITYF